MWYIFDMKIVLWCDRLIKCGFYALFLLTPLIFVGDTSELFEFNKMWFIFGVSIFIGTLWIIKMIFDKKISLQRTVLDIPIVLFLVSQLIATIFSLDRYVSFWGYYSRFNGGLLSLITYIFLYYALVSNTQLRDWIRMIYTAVFSGILVALWGLPSHFGYDPTCLVFRGTFDVSCWTTAFQPKVRIFSTLGQPDWLAAHLAVIIPIALSLALVPVHAVRNYSLFQRIFFIAVALLFYVDLTFTGSRSGYIAVVCGILIFVLGYLCLNRKTFSDRRTSLVKKHWVIASTVVLFLITTFFIGQPIGQLNNLTLPGIRQTLSQKNKPVNVKPASSSTVASGEFGGTDSGKIRLFVWDGALKAWEHNVLFGTGVETFAYAYYLYRPAGHNLTSEWDYLYNKAHNEYLNYLTTTGLFGALTYLSIIGLFLFYTVKSFIQTAPKEKQLTNKLPKKQVAPTSEMTTLLLLGLIAGYVTILITNFFGFSVVTINFFFFLIPAFVLTLAGITKSPLVISFESAQFTKSKTIDYGLSGITIAVGIFMIIRLISFWNADKSYAYGSNLDHAGYWQNANAYLRTAVMTRPDEPVFQDELSMNDAVMALGLAQQKDGTKSAQFAQEAIALNATITKDHPNSVVYWKTRVRLFYTLSQINKGYLPYALEAIQKASQLAPTDAKVWYNLGLLLGQTGHTDQAIVTLQKTLVMKNDYQDAYYALGLMYHESAVDKDGTVIKPELQQKAVDEMHFILKTFNPNDQQSLTALKSWNAQ